jgi:hypothetical protein
VTPLEGGSDPDLAISYGIDNRPLLDDADWASLDILGDHIGDLFILLNLSKLFLNDL